MQNNPVTASCDVVIWTLHFVCTLIACNRRWNKKKAGCRKLNVYSSEARVKAYPPSFRYRPIIPLCGQEVWNWSKRDREWRISKITVSLPWVCACGALYVLRSVSALSIAFDVRAQQHTYANTRKPIQLSLCLSSPFPSIRQFLLPPLAPKMFLYKDYSPTIFIMFLNICWLRSDSYRTAHQHRKCLGMWMC